MRSIGATVLGVAVLAALSIAPACGPTVSEDGSVGPTVAEVVDIIRDSGLPYETNAMFTNVEGSLEEVLDLVKRCTEHVAANELMLPSHAGRGRRLRTEPALVAGRAPCRHTV